MKIVIACVISTCLLLTIINHAQAAPSADISVKETFYWLGVIQDGDMVIISRYDTERINGEKTLVVSGTEAASCAEAIDWDNCQSSDIWVRLIDVPSGDALRERTIRRLGHGLVAFYLSPDEVENLASLGALSVEYIPSPLTFEDISQRKSIAVLRNNKAMTEEIIRILLDIENEFPAREGANNTYNFVEGQLISNGSIVNFGDIRPTGWDILTSAHPALPSMVSSAFQISSESLDEQFGSSYLSYLREDYVTGSTNLRVIDVGDLSIGQRIRIGGVRPDGEIYSEYSEITAINQFLSEITISSALSEDYPISQSAFVVLTTNIEVETSPGLDLSQTSNAFGIDKGMLGGLIWAIFGIAASATAWQTVIKSSFAIVPLPMSMLIGYSFGHVPTSWIVSIMVIGGFIIAMMIARSLTRSN